MMDFVPLALGCGHHAEGMQHFRFDPEKPTEVLCPEGCGWQRYVIEPHEGEFRCLCPPGRHTCGEVTTVVADLGFLNAGDDVEVDLGDDN
jgi:hypothetical protein